MLFLSPNQQRQALKAKSLDLAFNHLTDTVDLALLFAYAKNDFLSNLISVANFLSKSLRAFLIFLEANLLAFTHAGWSLSLYFTKVFLFLSSNRTHLLVNQTGLHFLVPETFFFGTLASTKDKIKFLKLFQAVSILPSSNRSQSVVLNTLTLALPSAFYRDQLVTSVVCDDAWKSSP